MDRRIVSVVHLVCLLAVLASCRSVQELSLQEEVEQAEQRWAEQGVNDYRIVVVTSSIWHMQVHHIVVRDGDVAESSATCEPAPVEMGKCEVRPFDAEDYTVPGLFARARWLAQSRDVQYGRIEFDATYSFPARMFFDHPEMIDEEWGWRVEAFEVLE
jgi:hypothetical protein